MTSTELPEVKESHSLIFHRDTSELEMVAPIETVYSIFKPLDLVSFSTTFFFEKYSKFFFKKYFSKFTFILLLYNLGTFLKKNLK